MRELEPFSFDRALSETVRELERRRRTNEPLDDALPGSLLDEEALPWLREARLKDPLAQALEGWLLRVREQAHFDPARRALAQAQRVRAHNISEPERTRLPLSEMLSLALARPRERAAYLRSYFASTSELSDQVRRLWEDRQQFAERLGTTLDSFEVASPALAPAARNFLAATASAYETLRIHDPERLITVGLAESANEGWPARLSLRSTTDLLGDPAWLAGLRIRPFAQPRALGASSFMLALARLGRATSEAASARRSPFALAHDVFELRPHKTGALFGMLPVSSAFATRRLGLGSSHTRDHLRAIAQALLTDARVAAFRVLLRDLFTSGSGALRRELPELSHGALGFELPFEVAGSFIRVRPRDTQRFAGSLLGAAHYEALVQAHDDDWFRNPRAIAELRAELGEPDSIGISEDTLTAGARALSARLEPLL
jgi:hypothetical protein